MGSLNKKERCIYCGSDEDMTDDHVPPKSLFPKPRPNDLFTVPSCEKCNVSFQKDDDYFATMLTSCQSVSDDKNASKVNKKFIGALYRPQAEGFKEYILSRVIIRDIKSPGGIILGKTPAFEIDEQRFDATAKRITKGLFYKIHDYPIPEGYQIDQRAQNGHFQLFDDFFKAIEPNWGPLGSIGGGIFKYRYAEASNSNVSMAIIFVFYDKIFFHITITPETGSPAQPEHQ